MKKLIFVLAIVIAIFSLAACDMLPGATPGESGSENHQDVITVEGGYLVVNGVKTEYKASEEYVVTIEDGYVVVNGVKTDYKLSDCEHIWESVTTAPTCTAGGYDTMTCKLCDKSVQVNETEMLEHTYGENYVINVNYHWFKCTGCDATQGKESHTLGDDGICTICQLPISATPGVIYGISADGTYAEVVGYEGTATKIKIAEEYDGLPVKNIYSGAFEGNETITSVVIPDSVTSIGSNAFYNCSSLEYNEYKDFRYLGTSTNPYFALIETANKDLSSYEIHNDTRIITSDAFINCRSITSIVIPEGVISIGESTFNNCSLLESVVFRKGVSSIGDYAFYNCNSLTSVIIPDSVTSIGKAAFSHCYKLASIVIPDSVTNIGDSVFEECSALESVVIPGGVTSIPEMAFCGCTSLASVTIPDGVTSIGSGAFAACYALTSIKIPDSVTSIADSVFYECTSLTSIVIPDSVTSIEMGTFGVCSSLTSVVIGKGVKIIAEIAFIECSSLTDVYYTGSEEEWSKISIGVGNEELQNATVHYEYALEK